MIKYAPHNSLLTVHFCFCVFRYFPPGWLLPWRGGPCPAGVWHSSHWHSKEVWLWAPPAKGHQGEWCEERGPLDNYQAVAQWLWLWQHKKGLLGVVWKTWCWISRYESLHIAHFLRSPWEYLQRWMNSEKNLSSTDGSQKPSSATFACFLFHLLSRKFMCKIRSTELFLVANVL